MQRVDPNISERRPAPPSTEFYGSAGRMHLWITHLVRTVAARSELGGHSRHVPGHSKKLIAGSGEVLSLEDVNWQPPGQKGRSGWRAPAVCVVAIQLHARSNQAVDVRRADFELWLDFLCFVPVVASVSPAPIIHHEKHDMRRTGCAAQQRRKG